MSEITSIEPSDNSDRADPIAGIANVTGLEGNPYIITYPVEGESFVVGMSIRQLIINIDGKAAFSEKIDLPDFTFLIHALSKYVSMDLLSMAKLQNIKILSSEDVMIKMKNHLLDAQANISSAIGEFEKLGSWTFPKIPEEVSTSTEGGGE
jgi:hypothetical protein